MKPLDLALKYMDIFFSGKDLNQLSQIFSKDITFDGPIFKFNSAKSYLQALKKDPPQGMNYKIIKVFEQDSSVCLFYQFSKPGISLPMAQLFEIENNKISKILLIFDTSVFS